MTEQEFEMWWLSKFRVTQRQVEQFDPVAVLCKDFARQAFYGGRDSVKISMRERDQIESPQALELYDEVADAIHNAGGTVL